MARLGTINNKVPNEQGPNSDRQGQQKQGRCGQIAGMAHKWVWGLTAELAVVINHEQPARWMDSARGSMGFHQVLLTNCMLEGVDVPGQRECPLQGGIPRELVLGDDIPQPEPVTCMHKAPLVGEQGLGRVG